MDNAILFFNEFFSYIVLLLIIVIVAGCGVMVGKLLRQKKDAKLAAEAGNTIEPDKTKI